MDQSSELGLVNIDGFVQMDKASIVGDAIEYVKELQQEVEDIESEISELEKKAAPAVVNESSAGSMDSDGEEREPAGSKEVQEVGVKVVTELKDDVNTATAAAAMEPEKPKPLAEGSQLPILPKRILNVSSKSFFLSLLPAT